MQDTIQTIAGTATFKNELNSIDVAQALIDWYKKHGKYAVCLHKNNKHQLYVVEKENK